MAAERMRHLTPTDIGGEGWTLEHDQNYVNGELAKAGACYVIDYVKPTHLGFAWPWLREWWKPTPKDPIRQLVKAGALIAAEIDRLLELQRREQLNRAAEEEKP